MSTKPDKLEPVPQVDVTNNSEEVREASTTPERDTSEEDAPDKDTEPDKEAETEGTNEAPKMSINEARIYAEFAKVQADTRLVELSCVRSQIEIERAKIEVEGLRRREAEAAAEHASLIYTFYDEVRSESVKTCMATLTSWSRRDPSAGITIIFNSPGGSVIDGLALFDFLRHLSAEGHHVTTVALGQAASMGSVLLQAGDTRVVGRNTFVMLHQVAAGSFGKSWQIEEGMDFIKRLEGRLLELLAERSNMTITQIKRRWTKTDWWMDAKETVERGFADEIR